MTSSSPALTDKLLNATVIVTGLGFMVDLFDLWIFNVNRTNILTDLGVTSTDLTTTGLAIINYQMAGLLLGSIFFGVLGDRMGRKISLVGSILLYSLATLACGFVTHYEQLEWLRFIAGFGLAGEVGVGVALITETMSKEKRGMGVAIFTFLGLLGVILAALAAEFLPWRTAFIIGGVAGLLLLITRSVVMESGLFQQSATTHHGVGRGNFVALITQPHLRGKFFCCIFMGLPIYFVLAIPFTLAPEISAALGIDGVRAAVAFATGYAFAAAGDLLIGLISQKAESRKRVVSWCMLFTFIVLVAFMVLAPGTSPSTYYLFTGLFGVTVGYFVNMVTIGAEQFGTNLRATTATTVPGLSRATIIPINLVFAQLKPIIGVLPAMTLVGCACLLIGYICLRQLDETYGKDLDYHN
jgi:putative MFS transporter